MGPIIYPVWVLTETEPPSLRAGHGGVTPAVSSAGSALEQIRGRRGFLRELGGATSSSSFCNSVPGNSGRRDCPPPPMLLPVPDQSPLTLCPLCVLDYNSQYPRGKLVPTQVEGTGLGKTAAAKVLQGQLSETHWVRNPLNTYGGVHSGE